MYIKLSVGSNEKLLGLVDRYSAKSASPQRSNCCINSQQIEPIVHFTHLLPSLCSGFPPFRGTTPFAKMHGKDQGSNSVKTPVSKVRPLVENSAHDRTPVSPGRTEGPR